MDNVSVYEYHPPLPIYAGASVVVILLHAAAMSTPTRQQTVDEELGIVMEDVTAS